MGNAEKIKILQENIMQWTEIQSDLFDRCMEGFITKEEYKEKSDKIHEYINALKKEIHELSK